MQKETFKLLTVQYEDPFQQAVSLVTFPVECLVSAPMQSHFLFG